MKFLCALFLLFVTIRADRPLEYTSSYDFSVGNTEHDWASVYEFDHSGDVIHHYAEYTDQYYSAYYNHGEEPYVVSKPLGDVYYYPDIGYMMRDDLCYLSFFPTHGCVGDPLNIEGFAPGYEGIPEQNLALWSDSYPFSFEYMPTVEFDNGYVGAFDSVVGFHGCYWDSYTYCSEPYPTLAIGCTDIEFIDHEMLYPMYSNWRYYDGSSSFFEYFSVLVVCENDLACARDCTGRSCGELDDCGLPCVGYCDDGQYCDTSDEKEYECMTSYDGTLGFFTQLQFNSLFHFRNDEERASYEEATFTHFEDALKQDIMFATNGLIVPEAVVIENYEMFGRTQLLMNLYAQINLDTINLLQGTDYSLEEFQNLVQYLFVNDAKYTSYSTNSDEVDDWPSVGHFIGPLTRYFDPEFTMFGDLHSGASGMPYSEGWEDSEWTSDITIPSSWVLDVFSDIEGCGSVTVCWTMLVAAVLAVLVW